VSMSAFAAMSFDEAASVMHPSATRLIRLVRQKPRNQRGPPPVLGAHVL
jgi:hypothetical protein